MLWRWFLRLSRTRYNGHSADLRCCLRGQLYSLVLFREGRQLALPFLTSLSNVVVGCKLTGLNDVGIRPDLRMNLGTDGSSSLPVYPMECPYLVDPHLWMSLYPGTCDGARSSCVLLLRRKTRHPGWGVEVKGEACVIILSRLWGVGRLKRWLGQDYHGR